MRLSQATRQDHPPRSAVALALAFIYIPLLVIVVEAFNSSRILKWPPPGFTLQLVRQGVRIANRRREALLTSIEAGAVAMLIAVVLGDPDRARRRPPPLLRPRIDLLPRHPADRPARHRHRRRPLQHLHPGARDQPQPDDGDHRPRHLLHRRRLQQRRRPPAPHLGVLRGSLRRPRRRPLADLPLGHLPLPPQRPRRRRPARLRPLLRRDRRHQLHDRRRRRNPADLDLPQPLPPQRAPDRPRRRGDPDPPLDHPRLPRPPPLQRRRRPHPRPRRRGAGPARRSPRPRPPRRTRAEADGARRRAARRRSAMLRAPCSTTCRTSRIALDRPGRLRPGLAGRRRRPGLAGSLGAPSRPPIAPDRRRRPLAATCSPPRRRSSLAAGFARRDRRRSAPRALSSAIDLPIGIASSLGGLVASVPSSSSSACSSSSSASGDSSGLPHRRGLRETISRDDRVID